MRPYDAAKRVGIHVNTVRTWTMQEFREFFSPTAQGGNGHTRDINDDDLRVLTFIHQLKNEGRDVQDIVGSLMAAQRRGLHNLPLPGLPETIVPMAVVPRQSADDAVLYERRVLTEKISYLETRVGELESKLDTSNSERENLIRELAEVKTELRLYKQGWRPPAEG